MINIIVGNCLETLKELPDQSVNCCVTSPPYFGLRDYGEADQIGLESTPDDFVDKLVDVFSEVKRVLKDDGTLWLNLGDSYWNNFGGGSSTMTTGNAEAVKALGRRNKPKSDVWKIKDLIGIPWKVAEALREPIFRCHYCKAERRFSKWPKWDNGFFLICPSCGRRCGNRQPEKISDGWFLRQDIIWHKPNPMPESVTDRCTKAHEYIFLLSKNERYFFDSGAIQEKAATVGKPRVFGAKDQVGTMRNDIGRVFEDDGTRNKRSVWPVNVQPFTGAHFATFPPDLIMPCILAGCPENGTVLDPFGGAGTTGLVAHWHNRNAILCELNPAYAQLAKDRIMENDPMFAHVEVS